ncbi:MAG: hypothetical protein WCL34_16205 [Methylococcaceae bacterium]
MKPSDIKFDLPFNGTKLCRLDDLKNNLTAELLEPFRTGKLARWLRVRKLVELADNVEALLAAEIAANNQREVQSLKGLMELFDGETDENLLRAAIAERKQVLPSVQNSNDEEVESLKAEIETLKAEVEKEQSEELDELRNLCRYYQTNLSDALPRLNSVSSIALALSFSSFLPRFAEISPQIQKISDLSEQLYNFVEAFNVKAGAKCKGLGL